MQLDLQWCPGIVVCVRVTLREGKRLQVVCVVKVCANLAVLKCMDALQFVHAVLLLLFP